MYDNFTSFVTEIWQHRPIIVVLLGAVAIGFILVIIDAHRHRRRQKRRYPKKH